MRPDYTAFVFMLSGLVSFNAGIWQVVRHKQKRQLMERHKNMLLPPLHTLPPDDGDMAQYEYRRVELDGSLDNDASCLVGPRSVPSYKGAANSDESRGGFLIITPFQLARGGKGNNNNNNSSSSSSKDSTRSRVVVADDADDDEAGPCVMVNRGWVPIDAGKYGAMLRQYTGEGVVKATLRGIVRREEYMGGSLLTGARAENEGPLAAGLAWLVIRPWNMAMMYYKQRWGADKADAVARTRGVHHYYIEMIEDYSGDDQRIVRGHAWPRRRDMDEITYVHLTPIVHVMYIVFWWSVTAGSLYGVSKCWQRQKAIFALRRHVEAQTRQLLHTRQANAQAYMDAVKDVERLKLQQQQHHQQLHAGGSNATGSAGARDGSTHAH